MNTIITKIEQNHTCPICQKIAFPPVKWNIQTPLDNNIPRCNHIYCINCTRLYFQLDKKVIDRKPVRYECLVCQQSLIKGSCYNGLPQNSKDVYYHCNNDEYIITQELILKESPEGRKCVYDECNFKTIDPYKMKIHSRDECKFNVITCPNRYYGCKISDKRDIISNHAFYCEYLPIKCKLCLSSVSKKESILHLINNHHVNQNVKFSDLLEIN
jgi:hypothetical protein